MRRDAHTCGFHELGSLLTFQRQSLFLINWDQDGEEVKSWKDEERQILPFG